MEIGDNEVKEPFLGSMAAKGDVYAEEEKKEEHKYGCYKLKPSCLQCFNKIQVHVICQCVFNFFEGFVVNGVINVVLVALEKRYSLPSSKSGVIASSNDFGAVVFLPLIGYFGEQRHKPRLMGTGILLMALGCFVFALPQFISDKYEYTISGGQNQTENMCSVGDNSSSVTCQMTSEVDMSSKYNGYYALLMIGNILLGIGAAPMFTIGLSYIDENCKPKLSSFYISWTFCAAAVGVAIGYVVGGQTLSLFVDIDKVDPSSVPLTPMDPQWVGAWWIGSLIALGGLLIVAIPICGYPRRLPTYDEVQKYRKSEAHGGGDELAAQTNFGKSWKDFPKSIFLLLKNPTYVFICLGAATEALIIGGMATFGAKLMQEKFHIDLTRAGLIMGIITIPGSGGGMLLGGYLVKRFKLKFRGIIRLCAGFMFSALLFGPFFLASCPNDPLVGVDQPYLQESNINGLLSACNQDCGCSTRGFEPICMNETIYFSPCHAGCEASISDNGNKIYHNCTCLSERSYIYSVNETSLDHVTSGLCTGECDWLYAFGALFLIVMILTFATMSPGVAALFRCVPDKQRSLALGVNLLFVRLVGTTPGPIFLGAIIDSACTVWEDACGVQGTCWVYDKQNMGIRIMAWFMGLKCLGVLFFTIGSFVYKPPPEDDKELEIKSPENIKTVTGALDSNIQTGTFSKL